ncbi:hypothetical protein B0H63DRAFT_317930 [Podospora didyma]|uniref:Ankyrin repeat protein n=1 Tax=Podospora didyma TaxID=330526 RepID=A0AAE0K644_9PEZI|nr:hypothetical protein B0H63DRAFT_317930 [Podospora didyma]
MAELIGIVAGVAGIADVGMRVSRRVQSVAHEWKNAPDQILALGREVSDLAAIMRSVQDACRSVETAPSASTELVANLRTNVDQAARLLAEIDHDIQELASLPKRRRRSRWLGMRPLLEQKRQELQDIRCNIRDLFGSQASSSNVRVELELESLQISLQRTNEAVEEKLGILNNNVLQLSQQLADLGGPNTNNSLGTNNELDSAISMSLHQLLTGQQPAHGRTITPAPAGHSEAPARAVGHNSGIISIRTTYRNSHCPTSCKCSCHSQPSRRRHKTWKMPPLLRGLLGVLFAQYSGSPASAAICSSLGCLRNNSHTFEIVYDFPLWCVNKGIHLLVQWGMTGSPVLALMPRYRVSFRAGGLLHAVNSSNIDLVRAALEAAPYSVHYQAYSTGYTALHFACIKCDEGSAEVLRLLLRYGADFDTENDNGQSAGSMAACQILLGIMPKRLLTELSSWKSVSQLMEEVELSPVSEVVLGIRMGNIETMLENMSASRLKLNEFDNTGNTPLYWAARAGNLGAVKALVKFGVDINIETKSGKTPLIGACDSTAASNTECFRWLLCNGADTHQYDARGFNCLTSACCRRTLPAVRELLSWGVNVNSRDAAGRTALGCAAQFNQDHIVTYLIDHNADTELVNAVGWTPILEAALGNAHGCLRVLLNRGANYRFVSRYGWTILHCAAQAGDLKTMEILTQHGLLGVDALAVSRMYGAFTAEELFFQHRRRQPQAEVLLAALRTLISVVQRTNVRARGAEHEELNESEDIFYDAFEYL